MDAKIFLSTTHHLQQSACNLIFVLSSRSQRLSRWSLLQRIAQLFSIYSKQQVSSDNTKVATTRFLTLHSDSNKRTRTEAAVETACRAEEERASRASSGPKVMLGDAIEGQI